MKKYALGIDYGTLSGRCVLVDVATGEEIYSVTKDYSHGVMTKNLPDGTPLESNWAVQHPMDYIEVIEKIPSLLHGAKVNPQQVISLGIDATACSMLPIKKDGTPLCMLPKYSGRPHAYLKLWKHHAAQSQAHRLNKIASNRGESFLHRYGGKISSEWAIPKIWQMLEEDPELYDETDIFVEVCDWVIFKLCGVLWRNSVGASLKTIWSPDVGYPSKDFFAALSPKLENVVKEKLDTPIIQKGEKAGEITLEGKKLTGLNVGTVVAVADLDGTAAPIGAGVVKPGQMLMVLGTSNIINIIGTGEVNVPGMNVVAKDIYVPGYTGYEAGQNSAGDVFQWVVDNIIPEEYAKRAKANGQNLHQYLTALSENKRPGESGLLCLDWWNGNRSILVDADLSGLILGLNLHTKVEDIYRGVIESVAFGTRMIVDTYKEYKVFANEIYISGGIAQRNPMVMQIFADVLDSDIHIIYSPNLPAFSSAIWSTIAAGKEAGGYDSIDDAVKAMAKASEKTYHPIKVNTDIYNKIYAEYKRLYMYFGAGENSVMKNLLQIAAKEEDYEH